MIKFVVALMPEAEPIIAHYGLEPIQDAFRIFRKDDTALIVSGIGKSAAAAATAYLQARTKETGVWFNVGIAGHRDRPVGTSRLAREVVDKATGKRWRLEVPEVNLPSDTVWTVDRTEKNYENDGLYEMEAAGFLTAATRFSPPGLVQCFKVVSDNRNSSAKKVTPTRVRKLIEKAMPDLAAAVRATLGRVRDIDKKETRRNPSLGTKPRLNPPLKWAGGKRWLVPRLKLLWSPYSERRFVEPLCGGLAVPLGLMPKRALLNDVNPHLMYFYDWLRKGLKISLPMENDSELFYTYRDRFNELLREGNAESKEAAEIFYYMNRTGYNGLCRFNRKGEFNVPFGKYKRINYVKDFESYKSVFSTWTFTSGSFEEVVLEPDDFVYADPPYDVQFRQYSAAGFDWDDQVELAEWISGHRGPVVLSNQATERIVELYEKLGFELRFLPAPRRISCTGDRTPAQEVLATKGF